MKQAFLPPERALARLRLSVMALGCASAMASPTPEEARFFREQVAPVLEARCFKCHSHDAGKIKGGLTLDSRSGWEKGGESGAALVPGEVEKSLLIRAIRHTDPDLQMPKEKLPEAEIATLEEWVRRGAPDPREPAAGQGLRDRNWWSLKPLVQPALPVSAPRNPVDAFIGAQLEAAHLTPSPAADRRTLIRRVYYDLIGLPPSPREVAEFEADESPEAYEGLVTRLLSSPQYGEKWARHWLDTIHFADSHGYEHDIGRENAWRYRDYVIDAFNADTPYPRFIREQLAADVFFPEEPRLTAALGFLGAGLFDMSAFGTAPVTFDYLDRDDLVTQTMAAFSSTTANCARCHAHKFDPISQEDYYALQAVFAGILKGEVEYDDDPAVARERRGWKELLAAVEKQDATLLLAPEHAGLVKEWLATHSSRADWEVLMPATYTSLGGAELTMEPDGALVAGGVRPDTDTYTITTTTELAEVTAIRLEVLARESLPMGGPGRQDNGNLHLSEFELRVIEEEGRREPRTVKIRAATADFNQAGWGIERAIDADVKTAWGIHPAVGQSHYAVFELAAKLKLSPGAKLSFTLQQAHGQGHLIGALRLSATGAAPALAVALPTLVEQAMARPEDQRTAAQRTALAAYALKPVALEKLAKLPPPLRVFAAGKAVDILSGDPPRQARTVGTPKVVNVLTRGDFNKPGAVAEPGALSVLTHGPARFALANPQREGARRAALADWLAHPENVLTWRSIVNRVWHYHFGRGLCDTPNDFGRMGGVPSHPELLDWLAVWFRDDAKGSLKELHRMIVTSAVYRQASDDRPEATQLDAENRLLWRQNRQRLDADGVRDYALSAAGTLDLTMGGPAVQQFRQSKGPQATPALDYTSFDWRGPGANRRSIYRFVWRGIADPFMEALDFPDLGLLAPARTFSASPLQALALYNNRFTLTQSEAMARRVIEKEASAKAQVERAVWLAWSRAPNAREGEDFESYVKLHGLAAFCRILLNSNEFLFVD